MNLTAKQTKTAEKPKTLLPVDDPNFLTNREISWLEFNRRVLEEALNDQTPLLERLKFLSIFSTNLDEFFMIRVSGLKEQIAESISNPSPDGMSAAEQLREIRELVRPMVEQQANCLREEVLPQLAEHGIKISTYKELGSSDKKKLDDYFLKNIFPVLTPQAVDISHPFPYVSNLSLNLGLIVEPDKTVSHGKTRTSLQPKPFRADKIAAEYFTADSGQCRRNEFCIVGRTRCGKCTSSFPEYETGQMFFVSFDARCRR